MRSKRLGVALLTAAGATALAAIPGGGAAVAATTCTPAGNVQAIIDDSGSMSITDANNLRSAAIKLLINKPGNEKLILGATEFGSSAGTVFAPVPIGGAASAMQTALDAKIAANNGSTDYNLAFAQGKVDNPNAGVRIFLTDGAHNIGTYNNGHLPGPRTFVVGLGVTGATDVARLQSIASSTGGQYFSIDTSAALQSTMNTIDSAITGKTITETYTDQITKVGQAAKHSITIKSNVKTADLVISWDNPAAQFAFSATQSSGKASAAKARKVKLAVKTSPTFITVRASNLKKGKLKIKITNKALTVPTTVTTQVSKNLRVKKKSTKKSKKK